MRKCRLYSLLRKTLSALLCLSMMLSIVTVTDFSGLFHFTEKVKAADAPDPKEYEDETLEHMWDSNGDGDPTDEDYWNAARSYYTCAFNSEADARSGKFTQFGGVNKRTIFHVYAFEGETICLGSSVFNSGIDENNKLKSGLKAVSGITGYENSKHFDDKDSCDIVMTDLKGNKIPIDIRNSEGDTTGYIASPNVEFAAVKMKMNTDGTFDAKYDGETYTPYTYKVKESGVYTFEFHSYDGTGAANPNQQAEKKISSQWPTAEKNYIDDPDGTTTYNDSGGLIAALNITVFDENCKKQTGRTYADCLSLQMSNIPSKNVTERYYILTTDSYIYKMQFNNAMPYTYNFFSNNRGIFDNATGEIIYKSVKDVSNTNVFPKMGSFFVYPGNKETEKDKSFYIFLEYPNPDLEGTIYQKAVQPDPATNIRFVGQVEINDDGSIKKVPGAYVDVGGYFAFDVKEATTATLRLDFNNIKEKSPTSDPSYVYAPVEISGVVKPNSTNYFYWDGCDGNGVPIPAGKYNLNDIVYTVTAKAGEIHFPIFDMECAPGGITFERMSHIYDKNGTRLDYDTNIYGMTKNVIYYDETAIYYGENVGVTGISESNVTGDPDNPTTGLIKTFFAANKGSFWQYRNLNKNNGEYKSRTSSYIGETDKTIGTNSAIRIGDHSHTTNVIQYFSNDDAHVLDETEVTQQQKYMIDYLNSKTNPVGLSDNTGKETTNALNPPSYNASKNNGMSTTDFAIANYWTFIPAKPATAINKDDPLWIVDSPTDEELFKLSGRVFYDGKNNGVYDDSGENGEHLLNGVTLKLYKKTKDSEQKADKEYYNYYGSKMVKASTIVPNETYELVDTGITRTDGSYVFTNLTYDPTNGTEYLYEVIRPNSSYTVTSSNIKAQYLVTSSNYYGYYSTHSYDKDIKGTEIQIFTVGGKNGVDPTCLMYELNGAAAINVDNSVCVVDVGYNYALLDRSLTLKKEWNTTKSHPEAVVYEVSYLSQNSTTETFEYHTLSAGGSWTSKNQFLPTNINGSVVADYFVSSEYFIYGDYIYKYTFDYDKTKGKYQNFLGHAFKISLDEVFSKAGIAKPSNCSISNLPDLNKDGVSDGADLGKIVGWETTNDTAEDCYRAVLDRNMLPDSNSITITNANQPGTIEIYKFHDEDDAEKNNALQGATFRLYKGDMKTTMENVSKNDETWISKNYIGSATTRANGHLTFTGLDSSETYTVREMFAPDGYRILQEYYEVRPFSESIGKDEENVFKFDKNHYAFFAIGNAPADTSLKIRKRIVGRAWQGNDDGATEDAFTFNIVCNYNSESSDDSDIKANNSEYEILSLTELDVKINLSNFAKDVTNHEDIAIRDSVNKYYSYEVYDEAKKTNITYTSADTKMSDDLLTDSEDDASSVPKFQGIAFPMAGEYTFTITENNPASDDALNLEHSTYTYKVTVAVVRKFNPEVSNPETTDMNSTNTHLEAEVSNIVYRENNDAAFKTFSGSSPLFTNTYKTAPAEQKTSYKIVKDFTGRTDNKWKVSDEFTVEIRSADSETIDAVKNGNLSISGFVSTLRDLKELPDGTGWEYTFTSKNHTIPLAFNSFKFEDIEFPVQYVDEKGNVWTPSEGSEQTTPTDQEITDNKLTPKTLPVTYKFTIKEKIPEDNKKGITYDESEYTLTIVLNNTEKSTNPDALAKEEEDGIIEEIDVTLSTKDSEGNEISSNCQTRQGVLDRETWLSATPSTYDDAVTFWYVDPSTGALKERPSEDPDTNTPKDTRLYFWKYEKHSSMSGDIFGTNGHTITIKNKYHTSYDWIPTIVKTLDGRDWLDDDAFKFTIEPDPDYSDDKDGYSMPDDKTVIIKKDTLSHMASLTSPIKFIKEGTYHFIITEKAKINMTDIELGKYKITVDVSDDGEGNLLPTITNDKKENINDKVIEFTNAYNDKEFTLNIAKTIEGREWGSDDKFTFKITPDDTMTKEAIYDGTIKMPDGVTADGVGSYTVELNDDGTTTGPEREKPFGNITIKNTGELTVGTQYKFTIEEVTENLEGMYCREPSIDLFVTITGLPSSHTGTSSKNGITATFAHVATGGTAEGGTEGNSVKIPFTNVAAGKLTVAKKVVSNSETDETAFRFNVEFKYYAAGTIEKDRVIKAVSKGGTEITPVKSSDENTWTYTFDLKDGEKVEFSNIPPKTEYKITETIKNANKEKYMLLRVCETATDNGIDLRKDGTGESVNGTLNPENNGSENNQYRLFVNGLIRELPSAGGGGIDHIIFLGTAFTVSAILLIAISYYKRRRRV